MKLRAIRLENVRRFTDCVEIDDIGDGLNVLSAPNEYGKSTVFDALHALFFKDRKSWDKEIRSLAPHAGGDPCVGADIEIGGGTYRIEKRWTRSRSGEVRVWLKGQLVKQADDAEAWLASVVKAPKDGGPAGLLWVRQGLTSLDEDGDVGRSARRDLMSSVAGEVEAMTGGRRMDLALGKCRDELGKYVTGGRGSARAGGPLKQVQDEVADLDGRRADLAATAGKLKQDLERRRQVRRELADLETPGAEAERQARLQEARKARDEAQGHAERLRQAQEAEERARREFAQAQERLDSLVKLEAELAEAGRDHATLHKKSTAAAAELARVKLAMEEAETRHTAAKASADAAAATLRQATRAEAVAAAATRRADLAKTLKAAEGHRSTMEEAQAKARQGITAPALERLETLGRELLAARRAVEAEAAWLSVSYVDGREGAISLDGQALEESQRIVIAKPTSLDVEGIGQIAVNPGAGADGSDVSKAEAALRAALVKAGVDTLEAARASAKARATAEARARDAKAALDALAPDGIKELRESLAALPEPDAEQVDVPDLATAEASEATARKALGAADVTREAARTALSEAQRLASVADKATEAAEARLTRATAALPEVDNGGAEIAARKAVLEDARAQLATASREREALAKDAPDLGGAQAAFARAESILQRAEEDRQRLRIELGQLDVAISLRAGEAVEEELADVEIRLEEARARLTALEFEVAVLQRLASALESARASARDRYVEPVKQELVPLLRLLWDDAELQFDADDVLPTSLIRDGQKEDFSVLSGGTREQIALLVRLAFARMLARAGTPAPVILDDAIVYTDDDRIERMFDALTRQAQDLQILVFSCRQKAFRDLGGRSLAIRGATSDAEVAQ